MHARRSGHHYAIARKDKEPLHEAWSFPHRVHPGPRVECNGRLGGRARLRGKPNLNGIWQAMNTANWNLEAHSARKIDSQWELGALFSITAGKSVVVGGKIPYLPDALKMRDQFRAEWPKSDPETYCYLPGIPRATYMPYPFQIVQGDRDILMVYSYATSNRTIFMTGHQEPPVDTWMGRSNGHWQGDTLVVETTGFNARAHLDRAGNHFSPALKVVERFTMENANVIRYEATWKTRRPTARRGRSACRSTSMSRTTPSCWNTSACRSSKSCSTRIWNNRGSNESSRKIGE
jgi:hypothetical protein